jgi:uncharacterized protein (DUF2141 family)
MKRLFILIACLIISSNWVFAQLTLEIEITGLHNNTGNLMLQLFNEKEVVITQEIGQIKDKMSLFSIHNLKPGKYAIRYYQDENLNGTMEKNKFGKPLEGYGFSNNVTAPFSMPPFEKWIFELKEDKKLQLKITY